jgi:hypothetical protein
MGCEKRAEPDNNFAHQEVVPYFFVLLTLVCVFALLSLNFLDWFEYQHLARVSIKTIGHVTVKEPERVFVKCCVREHQATIL